MRITFIALESYSLVGGLQQFNRRLVSALSDISLKNNYPKPIIVLKGDLKKHVEHRVESVEFLPCGYSKLALLKSIIVEARVSDLFLLGHVNLLPLAFISKIVNPKLKIVLFVHGEDVWNTTHARPMKFYEPLLSKLLDCVASVSTFTADRMAKAFHISRHKFIVFPNAVDTLQASESIELKQPTILTVARLAQHDWGKHHDSVLRAMPEILKAVPNAVYKIVGDGVLRSGLESLANELQIEHAVAFLGRISDDDLAQIYAEASVFVMPSEKEGFGIVFLEAWLRNIPVICGTEDASHEVVSDGVDGFAIHHDDIGEISKKVIKLLENPDLASDMGKAGRQKVLRKYLMVNFTANLEYLINEVYDGRS